MKILFVRINDKIGDTVIETFFYRELKRLFPKAHLTVMCCGDQTILNEVPYVDELILLPAGGIRKIATAFKKLPFIWKQKYDLLISFTPHWRMKFFNAFVSAARKEFFDFLPGMHVSVAYEHVLKNLGQTEINTHYEIPLPASARQAADLWLLQNNLQDKPFLFFNPSGGDKNRTLGVAQVNEILREMGDLPIVLSDVHQQYPVKGPQVISVSGIDILQTAALVNKAAYILTVDTAIAHIAEAFDKPMTVLFSLKNYAGCPAQDLSLLTVWGPRGPRVQKLHHAHAVCEIPAREIATTVLQNWTQEK